MKQLLLLLLVLISAEVFSCQIYSETTSSIVNNSQAAYIAYVTSLRVRDFEDVSEDQFPPIQKTGLFDREIKLSVVETIFGEFTNESLINLELSWCGSPNVQVGEKVIVFLKKTGNWEVKRIGVNIDDLKQNNLNKLNQSGMH